MKLRYFLVFVVLTGMDFTNSNIYTMDESLLEVTQFGPKENELFQKQKELKEAKRLLYKEREKGFGADSMAEAAYQQQVEKLKGEVERLKEEVRGRKPTHMNQEEKLKALQGSLKSLEEKGLVSRTHEDQRKIEYLKEEIERLKVQIEKNKREKTVIDWEKHLSSRLFEINRELEPFYLKGEVPINKETIARFKALLKEKGELEKTLTPKERRLIELKGKLDFKREKALRNYTYTNQEAIDKELQSIAMEIKKLKKEIQFKGEE